MVAASQAHVLWTRPFPFATQLLAGYGSPFRCTGKRMQQTEGLYTVYTAPQLHRVQTPTRHTQGQACCSAALAAASG